MNISQQRFYLLLQKLEGLETELAAARKDISGMEEFLAGIDEMTQVMNFRLIFAGQALLGYPSLGFKEEARRKFNGCAEPTAKE